MFKNKLEKIILEKIKRENIKPTPRIFFIIKNLFFWFAFLMFLIFGAISFASILYKISGNFDIIKNTIINQLHVPGTILYTIPFFWLILLFLFSCLSILNYKKTKLFYRRNMYLVILSTLILSFILGSIMFYLGFAQKTEEVSQKYIPFYNKYLKIQNLKKNIFIKKLKNLGVTQDILKNNPQLKFKISEKFNKNVLGKIYLFKFPNEECLKQNFKCQSDEIFFSDEKGCGCREIYFDLK